MTGDDSKPPRHLLKERAHQVGNRLRSDTLPWVIICSTIGLIFFNFASSRTFVIALVVMVAFLVGVVDILNFTDELEGVNERPITVIYRWFTQTLMRALGFRTQEDHRYKEGVTFRCSIDPPRDSRTQSPPDTGE